MRNSGRPARALLLVATAMTLIGCGGKKGPDHSVLKLAEVQGVVTLDGAPLSGARIEFHEADEVPARICFGQTDDSGRYEIRRDLKVPGCLPGEMIVRITSASGAEGESAPAKDAKIPARYNSKSELRVTVEPHGTHSFDFDLKSN